MSSSHSTSETPRLTRRRLLQAAGLGALGVGAGQLAPLPMVNEALSLDGMDGAILGDDFTLAHRWRDRKLAFQPTTSTKQSTDVLIVGGGVAGLTSAWRLQRAGFHNFQLLERSDYLGGIAHAGRVGEHRFPWGAHYVDPPSRDNKGLCKIYEDCKVILGYHPKDKRPLCDPRFIVKPPHRNILAGGEWRRGLLPWHIASEHDRRALQAFSDEMEYFASLRDREGRRAFGFPIDRTSRAPATRGLDQITMKAFLLRKGLRSSLLFWLVNDRCIDEFSLPIDQISAWAGIQYFASLAPLSKLPPPPGFPHDPRIDAIDPTDRKMSWPEGNAFLVESICKHLPAGRLHTHRMVVNIQEVADGVLVTDIDTRTMKSTTTKARQVIFAAPKYMVYHCIPALRESGRKAFRDVLYVPWIVGHLRCTKPPVFPKGFSIAWENNRFQSWSQGYIHPQHHLHPGQPPTKGPTILSFYACLAYQPRIERHELLNEGWDFWARQIVAELARMHPELPAQIERLDIYRWGHAMHAPRPGFLFGGTRDAIRKPFGRIHFSQSDAAGLAVFEQVAVRGIEVAEDVMSALQHPFPSFL